MLILLALLATAAHAGGLQPRTSREPLPAREIERPLVLPKGWTAVHLELGHKVGDRAWSADGEARDLADPLRLTTSAVTVTHGLMPGHEISLTAPWHRARAGEARSGAPGDVGLRWRASLLRREPPNQSIAVDVGWTAPAGSDATAIPLGAGTPALSLGLAARRQLAGLGLTGRIAGVRRFPGPSALVGDGLNRLDPGDRVESTVEALLQLAPLVVAAEPSLVVRAPDRVEREVVEGTGGIGAELRLRATLQVTRAFDLTGFAVVPLAGTGFAFPYAEALNPTAGRTWGGAVTGRF